MSEFEAGIAAAHEFIAAFNAQDHERLAASLNYPHVRFANGRFHTVEDAQQFTERSRQGEARLAEEGWHHTVVDDVRVIHGSDDKVHLAMRNDRCRSDGTPYLTFETLWIATCVDGHWGIQFRSSYLESAPLSR